MSRRTRGLVFSAIAIAVFASWIFYRTSKSVPVSWEPGWRIQQQGKGLVIDWNRNSSKLRSASALTLLISDAGKSSTIPLEGSTGTMYYTPEAALTKLTLRIDSPEGESFVALYGEAITEQAATHIASAQGVEQSRSRVKSEVTPPNQIKASGTSLAVPVVATPDSTSSSPRQAFTRSAVLPLLPSDLRKKMRARLVDVEVFVKINTSGKVGATSTRYSGNPVQKQLADLATAAVTNWVFEPVLVSGKPVDADARLSFRFAKSGPVTLIGLHVRKL